MRLIDAGRANYVLMGRPGPGTAGQRLRGGKTPHQGADYAVVRGTRATTAAMALLTMPPAAGAAELVAA